MKLITPELEDRFQEIGTQSETENPLVIAKFFDPVGSGTWYATEYDSKTDICYGYVTGLGFDEWGTFSVKGLESIKRPFGLGIERDLHFDETCFYDLFPEKRRLIEINKNKKEKSQEQER